MSSLRISIVVALALAGCNKTSKPVTPPAPAPIVVTDGLLRDLAILTTQSEPTPAMKQLAARGDLEGVVSLLVEDRTFTNTVAPNILLEDNRFPSVYAVQDLKIQLDEASQVWYLYKPCKPADATSVEPWWALGTHIMVCNDSYKPDVLTMPASKALPNDPPPVCGSNRGAEPPCGCGRNLMHCIRDTNQHTEIRKSLAAEVYDTIGHVVSSGAPIQDIYLTNATVRDGVTERFYRVHDATRGKPWTAGMEAFKDKALHPRIEDFPGMHAGILTTPNFARISEVPRSVMMTFFQTMTCSGVDGAQVNAHQTLGIDTANIRAESGGGNYLAHQKGCSGCHARLENSIPFFAAWRSVWHSMEVEPELQSLKEGKIYLNDITDLRATTTTTPAAFAKVVTAQPEFATCQAGRIANYILGADHVDAEVKQELATMIAAQKPARDVFKAALLSYARRLATGEPPKSGHSTSAKPSVFDVDAVRTFDTALVKALAVCEDCHSDDDRWIDKAVASHQTSALHALRMADVVASGTMPKDNPLSEKEREALVTMLTQAAWADAELGRETANNMLGYRRPASVHVLDTVVRMVDQTDGPAAEPLKPGELMVKPGYNFLTPGVAATIAIEALRVCRTRSPSNVEACVNKILDDEGAYQRYAPATSK